MDDDVNHFERFDPQSGLLMPWYTHPALDEILTWDLADKVVLEWGGGHSTKWWSSKAEHVHAIEGDPRWIDEIGRWRLPNVSLEHRNPKSAAEYARVPEGCRPDVVIIDGEHRRECLEAALALPRPITIVFDNWQQDEVFIDAEAEAMMRPCPGRFHVQPDHRNHAGKPWQTAIWHLGGKP